MFGFNKRRRGRPNVRARKTEDDGETVAAAPDAPKPVEKKADKEKTKVGSEKKKTSKLSFQEEEVAPEQEFKVKKSSMSRKLAREKEREKSKKIKDYVGPMSPGHEPSPPLPQTHGQFPSHTVLPTSASSIPDAYTIHQARKKRELARLQQQSDYIPVKDDERRGGGGMDSDEEEEGRVEMRVHTEDLTEMGEEMEESECVQWEEEQLRKGALTSAVVPDNTPSQPVSVAVEIQQQQQQGTLSRQYIPQDIPRTFSLAEIRNRLTQEVKTFEQDAQECDGRVETSDKALEVCKDKIAEEEKSIERLSAAFQFYQEMRCYLNDYLQLISVKVDQISGLEDRVLELFANQSLSDKEKRGKYSALTEEGSQLMSDVREEFCSSRAVREMFVKWKKEQPESYKDAYISQCLPRVMTPLINLEMAGWNPLLENSASFEEFPWFLDLVGVGDAELLQDLVQTALIPKVTSVVERCWRPGALAQSERLVDLVKLISEDYGVEGSEWERLNQAILYKVKQCVSQIGEGGVTECTGLLHAILLWDGVTSGVRGIALQSLLSERILPELEELRSEPGTVEVVEGVIRAIPSQWFDDTQVMVPELKGFAGYLVRLANKLGSSEQRSYKTAYKRVKSMLLRMHAIDLLKSK